MKVENIVGKPVQGDNFFGRDAELAHLQAISEREHALLLAPRRVGKTSLLHALVQRVEQDGSAIGVYASVAPASNEAEFVQTILTALYATRRGRRFKRGLASWARGVGRGVKSVKVAGSGVDLETRTAPWHDDADRAFAVIAGSDVPVMILIDELPVLVLTLARSDPTGTRVRAFLQWFRNLRQQLAGADKLRFVLTGSIGLDNVTRRYHLSDTINDLRLWPLGPFPTETAHAFLAQLATSYGMKLGPELRAAVCHAAEWLIPYHLQVIFSELKDHARSAPPTAAMLDAAIEALLDRRSYFSYWDERLHDALGQPAAATARAMLAICAQAADGAAAEGMNQAIATHVPDPAERARAFAWILDVLVNDGYLVRHSDRWRFRSGLLRRYWVRHVV